MFWQGRVLYSITELNDVVLCFNSFWSTDEANKIKRVEEENDAVQITIGVGWRTKSMFSLVFIF